MSTPRYFITGGSGFIGRNLIESLSPRHEVFAPKRAELNLLDDDAVRRYLDDHRVDVLIHGAVQPGHRNSKDPSRQHYNNTRMFFNLARTLRPSQRLLILSSGLVYDCRYYLPKMNESYFGTHIPEDESGFSKYIMARFAERHDQMTELRLFGVFGRYEDYAIRFISNAVCKALCDLPITLRQRKRFDYIYVNDLPAIIDGFLTTTGADTAYNVTPDAATDLYDIAERIRTLLKTDVPIVVGQPGCAVEYSGDNARFRSRLPNIRLTPLDDAILDLAAWYRAHQRSIDRAQLLVDK